MSTATGSTSVDPGARRLWRAARGPLLAAALVLLVALGGALLTSGAPTGLLDPRAVDRAGSRAVAAVLRDQGVEVQLVETTDAAVAAADPQATLLVTAPGLLVEEQLRRLAETPADLVLVAPQDQALEVLAESLTAADVTPVAEEREPACRLPSAQRAGTVEIGGQRYAATDPEDGDVLVCYATAGSGPLVQVRSDERTVTVLGDAGPLTNDRFDDDGNAALALGLLGANETLVWYLPSLSDVPAGAQQTFYSLVPDGVLYGLVTLLLAVVLLALWRMRRLGPVVPEPLPVVVRGAETVEGRARLYRRAGARDRSAEALRAGVRQRLGRLLSLPRGASPPALVDAAAARSRWSPQDVGALLYGAAPADDTALVALADALDDLEREVRRT